MSGPLRVAIAGTSGRMGRVLIETVLGAGDCQLTVALDRAESASLGQDAGYNLGQQTGVAIRSDVAAALREADVLIDFTRPEGTLAHLAICRELGVNLIVGTTGFDEAGKAALKDASQDIGIVFAPNMSVGVNLTFKLLEMAAKVLAEGYDIEIVEAHHRHKVDAPSGTALRMGEVIADALGRDLKDCAVYAREGVPASATRPASASPPSGAATSWVTTPCCLPAPASASRSRTSRPTALAMPRAACGPCASWPTRRPACSTCLTC